MADTTPVPTTEEVAQLSPEMQMLLLNKEGGYNYKFRREEEWRENYTLYRDRVIYNRLTQRQSINLPVMKGMVKTLLANVDDMPVLYFEELDNDKEAETFLNEYWKLTLEENKMEIKDIVDKKQDFLFGRTFDQMQIIDGKVKFTIVDPEDILVDRYCDPTNIDSSRFLIHLHIFKPLSYLENNPDFDQDEVAELKLFFASQQGLIKASDNQRSLTQKNQKMADMGLQDVDYPVLGETIVELSLHFVYRKEEGDDEEQLYMYVEAESRRILQKARLEEVIGKTGDHFWRNHFNYNSWADDVDMQDFWTDGAADIMRTPNKVLNSWISQLVENRTMRNFNMHYYDSTLEGFAPQSFNPIPWGWYPIPIGQGKTIDQVLKTVEIPDLSESLDEMTFVTQMLEKATGTTPTLQGAQTETQITLGEVQLALGQAKERVKGVSKFYTHAWEQRGTKFLKLIEAAPDKLDAVKIYKKGLNTNNLFSQEITPKDWESKSGYRVRVWSQDDKNTQDAQKLQKLNAVKTNMFDNPVVDDVFKRKLMEFGDFTPEQVNAAMEFEQKKREQMAAQGMMMGQQPGQPAQLGAGQLPAQQPQQQPLAQ